MALSAASLLWYQDFAHGLEPLHAAPAGVEYSRDSAATWVDGRGRVQSYRAGLPRTEWVTEDGELRPALLLEGSGTNYLLRSSELHLSPWVKRGNAVTAAAALAPDGTQTGTRVQLYGLASGDLYQLLPGVGAGPLVTSFWLRTLIADTGQIGCGNPYDLAQQFVFSAPPAGSGWVRVSGTFSDAGTHGGVLLYAVDGSVWTFDVWGMQQERAPAATSYMASGATLAAPRLADRCSMTGAPGPQGQVILTEITDAGLGRIGSNARVWQISAADNSLPYLVLYHTGSAFVLLHATGSASGTSTVAAVPAPGDRVRLCAVIGANGSVQLSVQIGDGAWVDGALSGAVPFASAWSAPLWWLNAAADTGTGYGRCHFRRLRSARLADFDATTLAGRREELDALRLGTGYGTL